MNTTRRVPRPARKILFAFLFALIAGTGLLMLPPSTTAPGSENLLPSLFTATSALCVTGLSDVDVSTHWTTFGHAVIMGLIQVGGFGVMSFATILGFSVTHKLSLERRITTATESHNHPSSDMARLLFNVIRTTLTIEAAIAVALTARFLYLGHPFGTSLWWGVFHAVSSFNNAGFSVFSGNMTPYVSDWFVNVPIMIGIILGGIGFPVIREIVRYYKLPRKWSMHTRMVLFGTAFLLVASTLYVTVIEWNNPKTLGPLPTHAKILAGMFQAVQTRTAGFNSVDIGQLHDATLFGMDFMMFIGGGPAGTAGGIKITTILVLLFMAWTEIRGETSVNVFGKRLSRAVHREAVTVTMLAIAVVSLGTLLLLLFTEHRLDDVMFEAISAFGTVGLSTGITPTLNAPSQLVLIALMMIGRLGPITFATAIAVVPLRKRTYELPKERPIIG